MFAVAMEEKVVESVRFRIIKSGRGLEKDRSIGFNRLEWKKGNLLETTVSKKFKNLLTK